MSLYLDIDNYQSNIWDYYPTISIPEIVKNNEYLNENIQCNNNSTNATFQEEEDEDDEFGNAYSKSFGSSKNNSNIDSDNDEDKIHYSQRKTEENSTEKKDIKTKNTVFKIIKTKKIFTIKPKEERKKGRLSIGNRPLYQPKHDKKSTDNIISKIKRHFVRSTLNYINKKYNEFLSKKKTENKRTLLKKIIPNSYKVYSRKENQKFLNLYLYQLFSQDLSNRIKEYSKDYNRKQIKLLYEENKAKEVIEIMNLTVKEIYEIYISNRISGFNLKNDLNNIIKEKDKEEKNDCNGRGNTEYKNKVKNIAENLVHFLSREGKE